MNRLSKIARTIALLIASAHFVLLLYLFIRRVSYPYDLEWMEGGMLCHSLRILDGKPLYARPSVDFIPFLYTPLYPAIVALLSKVFGLRYVLARAVSILSFLGATLLGYRFAARAGGSRAAAAVSLAIPAAAYVRTGSFYDLARPDSLWLFLVAAALFLLYGAARNRQGERRTDGKRHLTAAFSALLLVAAFFTKQTAAPFMVAAGAALLLLDWRLTFTFAGTLALFGLPSLYLYNRASGGWFWTYTSELHRAHAFYAARAFGETPIELIKIVGPALLLIPWALARRRSIALWYATYIASVGFASACLAFGTQWAFTNAYIPGVFFPAVAIAVAAGRLVTVEQQSLPRLRPAFVFALSAISLLLLYYDPRRDCSVENVCRPLVPTKADREAGDRLIARLRAADGEVLIPFHPFYAHLAGKRTWLHRMGVMDVTNRLGPPDGLAEAIRAHRFALAIFDYKVGDREGRGTWFQWPGLLAEYRFTDPPPDGPRTFSGAPTAPAYALVPRAHIP